MPYSEYTKKYPTTIRARHLETTRYLLKIINQIHFLPIYMGRADQPTLEGLEIVKSHLSNTSISRINWKLSEIILHLTDMQQGLAQIGKYIPEKY